MAFSVTYKHASNMLSMASADKHIHIRGAALYGVAKASPLYVLLVLSDNENPCDYTVIDVVQN